ncbi:hypothetical protein EHP00_682 [Ecytonucleospora hepatopenaei]|uniref:Uncharacterized protein n=1 Tax=Ecytonucleospora hepatopenaei TaxID=646526 RepID=A0A1W0E869_9MICR|nr:hypothetical protein EHP00_2570 [Ecytonucleospora hepatopenaei]OQS55579.1 hypothetical protein EHP00_682 [Ecytonucleospora hepatopenaei]
MFISNLYFLLSIHTITIETENNADQKLTENKVTNISNSYKHVKVDNIVFNEHYVLYKLKNHKEGNYLLEKIKINRNILDHTIFVIKMYDKTYDKYTHHVFLITKECKLKNNTEIYHKNKSIRINNDNTSFVLNSNCNLHLLDKNKKLFLIKRLENYDNFKYEIDKMVEWDLSGYSIITTLLKNYKFRTSKEYEYFEENKKYSLLIDFRGNKFTKLDNDVLYWEFGKEDSIYCQKSEYMLVNINLDDFTNFIKGNDNKLMYTTNIKILDKANKIKITIENYFLNTKNSLTDNNDITKNKVKYILMAIIILSLTVGIIVSIILFKKYIK